MLLPTLHPSPSFSRDTTLIFLGGVTCPPSKSMLVFWVFGFLCVFFFGGGWGRADSNSIFRFTHLVYILQHRTKHVIWPQGKHNRQYFFLILFITTAWNEILCVAGRIGYVPGTFVAPSATIQASLSKTGQREAETWSETGLQWHVWALLSKCIWGSSLLFPWLNQQHPFFFFKLCFCCLQPRVAANTKKLMREKPS